MFACFYPSLVESLLPGRDFAQRGYLHFSLKTKLPKSHLLFAFEGRTATLVSHSLKDVRVGSLREAPLTLRDDIVGSPVEQRDVDLLWRVEDLILEGRCAWVELQGLSAVLLRNWSYGDRSEERCVVAL